MIGYFGMSIHGRKHKAYDQMALLHFMEMSQNAATTAFAVHNHFLMKQVEYGVGITMKIIRPSSLYGLVPNSWLRHEDMELCHGQQQSFQLTNPYLRWDTWPRHPRTGLIFRSKYVRQSWVKGVIDGFAQRLGTVPFQLDNPVTEHQFLSFDDLKKYQFCVLFPWDPSPMAFWEMYRLLVPLFLPDVEWIIRI